MEIPLCNPQDPKDKDIPAPDFTEHPQRSVLYRSELFRWHKGVLYIINVEGGYLPFFCEYIYKVGGVYINQQVGKFSVTLHMLTYSLIMWSSKRLSLYTVHLSWGAFVWGEATVQRVKMYLQSISPAVGEESLYTFCLWWLVLCLRDVVHTGTPFLLSALFWFLQNLLESGKIFSTIKACMAVIWACCVCFGNMPIG